MNCTEKDKIFEKNHKVSRYNYVVQDRYGSILMCFDWFAIQSPLLNATLIPGSFRTSSIKRI